MKHKCDFCGKQCNIDDLIIGEKIKEVNICFDCVEKCKKLLNKPGKIIEFKKGE